MSKVRLIVVPFVLTVLLFGRGLALASTGESPAGAGPCGSGYTVKPGDTLYRIALKCGIPMTQLALVNGISNPRLVFAGQVLALPPTTGASNTGSSGGTANSNSSQQGSGNSAANKNEITGTVTRVGNGFIVVNGQTVFIGNNTEMKGQPAVGSVVQVEVFRDGNGNLSAREVKVENNSTDDKPHPETEVHSSTDHQGQVEVHSSNDTNNDHGGNSGSSDSGTQDSHSSGSGEQSGSNSGPDNHSDSNSGSDDHGGDH